ncbi:hypothetical protein VCSRO196_2533 [Vibrio cholerae]|nr:hypothetical protein VCSRO196_2533 [Vibrio cholerae]
MNNYKMISKTLILDCKSNEVVKFDMSFDIKDNPTIYIKYPICKFTRLKNVINAKNIFPEYFI